MISKAQNITRALFRCPVRVLLLFCIKYAFIVKADRSTQISGLSLSVGETNLLCVDRRHSVNLTCTLSLSSRRRTVYNDSNKLTSWNIKWHSNGEIIGQNSSKIMPNDTIIVSTLEVYVNWAKDKVFTCFAAFKDRNLSGPVLKLNASLTVSTRPEQTSIIGVRFLEASDHQLVELYWKQSEEFNYTYIHYSLRYAIDEDDFDIWGKKSYTINDIECFDRLNDVYRVPNTTGHICKASIKAQTFQLLKEYKAHLVTTRDQCESSGPKKKFMLWTSGDDPGPNKYDIVMIPHPVRDFRIRVVRQQVELTWTNMPNLIDRWYRFHYNCSELGVAKEQAIIGKTELTLYGSNFTAYRPYALCKFCIRVYLEDSEIPSLPFCREARLHEEAPSEPPTITCIAKGCATITDGRFRNVTIPWALPPRETWNGVLTHVVVKYRRAENGSSFLRIIERNLTQGFTVLPKLARNYSYMVQTAVCNKEGCSGYGNTILPALLEQQQQRNQDGKSNDDVTVFLGIGTAFILVVIGGIFVWCICRKIRKKRKQKEDQLPKLNEPNDYDNVCGDQMAPKEYDVLSDDVLIEQGESNAGLEHSDYSQETSV